MRHLLQTPLDELTIADVQRFVESGPIETDQLEFKSLFDPQKGQTVWLPGTQLDRDLKKGLLKEIVAFANAHGGLLLLGVEESDASPHRAVAIRPLPKCDDFADRLRDIVADSVRPPLVTFQAKGVGNPDGTGVVVAQIAKSRSAPHRSELDHQCYFRRDDRSAKMEMREIQDLTLNVARGMEQIERTFQTFKLETDESVRKFVRSAKVPVVGYTIAAVPVDSSLHLADIHDNDTLRLDWNDRLPALVNGQPNSRGDTFRLDYPSPILRGWVARDQGEDRVTRFVDCRMYGNGIVKFRRFRAANRAVNYPDYVHVYPSWILSATANIMMLVDAFRNAARSPAAEYALQLRIVALDPDDFPVPCQLALMGERSEPLAPIPFEPPYYALQDRSTFDGVLTWINRDIENGAGISRPTSVALSP